MRDININGGEYKQYFIKKNATIDCNVLVKFDFIKEIETNSENYTWYLEYLFSFGKMKIQNKSPIIKTISLIKWKDFLEDSDIYGKKDNAMNTLTSTTNVLNILKTEKLNSYSNSKYKYNFNKVNINIQYCPYATLHCHRVINSYPEYNNCHGVKLGCGYCGARYYTTTTDIRYAFVDISTHTVIKDYKYGDSGVTNKNGKYYCNGCNNEIIFDKDFVTEQLKGLVKAGCYNNCLNPITM